MARRVVLSIEDGFFGNFRLNESESFSAPILDLGVGGFHIAILKKTQNRLTSGDRMELVRIVGAANIDFNSHIPAEIIWIDHCDNEKYLSADCQFLGMGDEVREQVDRFVASERKLRGQYA
jgi:hypothetical protein